jgi:protein KRI1
MDAMLHGSRSPSPENDETRPLTHVQEQEALRRETIAAFHGAAAQIGDDDILIPREKTQDEREREEEEYRAFLEREVGDLKELVTVDVNEDEGEVKGEEEEEGEADQEDTTTEKKKKKKKKKSKKTAEEPVKKTKAEQDQEFLLKYVIYSLFSNLILKHS